LPNHDIVVVGTSVGGVEALQRLVHGLPERFPASLFVVLHLAPESPSLLPEILERAGVLSAIQPKDGDQIRHGQIYVAPPDRHMLVERGVVRVVAGPKENRHRPAIDPLFRSAALAYGPRVIGAVLTGSLDDGTAGLISIKTRGGLTMVQDPETAYCGDMPRSAMRYVEPDFVLPIEQIGPKIFELVQQPVTSTSNGNGKSANGNHGDLQPEVEAAELDPAMLHSSEHPGEPSPFACPECNGVLWEKKEGDLLHFRCRVGHAYTANNLAAEQSLGVESALWAALRALEENASLNERLAQRARGRRIIATADRFHEQAEAKKGQAAVLRKLLLEGQFELMKN
jgi:two-component system, chemotaxis family, protein-glutamate methylesterase/glutaminase